MSLSSEAGTVPHKVVLYGVTSEIVTRDSRWMWIKACVVCVSAQGKHISWPSTKYRICYMVLMAPYE